MYPDDCIQALVSSWWTTVKKRTVLRGHLLWAFVPHVDQEPLGLVPEGRSKDLTDHRRARYRLEPLRISQAPQGPRLPIAALPSFPGEVRTAYRAKIRPVLVVSTGGPDIPRSLRSGAARWQFAPTLLVAPYYGADPRLRRGGWRADFVRRIRRCEYPQYLWDRLPFGGSQESILRLDHVQPIGRHQSAYEWTPHCLDGEALAIVDEWLEWLIEAELPEDSVLNTARQGLSKLNEKG